MKNKCLVALLKRKCLRLMLSHLNPQKGKVIVVLVHTRNLGKPKLVGVLTLMTMRAEVDERVTAAMDTLAGVPVAIAETEGLATGGVGVMETHDAVEVETATPIGGVIAMKGDVTHLEMSISVAATPKRVEASMIIEVVTVVVIEIMLMGTVVVEDTSLVTHQVLAKDLRNAMSVNVKVILLGIVLMYNALNVKVMVTKYVTVANVIVGHVGAEGILQRDAPMLPGGGEVLVLGEGFNSSIRGAID